MAYEHMEALSAPQLLRITLLIIELIFFHALTAGVDARRVSGCPKTSSEIIQSHSGVFMTTVVLLQSPYLLFLAIIFIYT